MKIRTNKKGIRYIHQKDNDDQWRVFYLIPAWEYRQLKASQSNLYPIADPKISDITPNTTSNPSSASADVSPISAKATLSTTVHYEPKKAHEWM